MENLCSFCTLYDKNRARKEDSKGGNANQRHDYSFLSFFMTKEKKNFKIGK